MKKALLTTTILAAMIATAIAEEDPAYVPVCGDREFIGPCRPHEDLVLQIPEGKFCQIKSGRIVTNRTCKSPTADALVRRYNQIVDVDSELSCTQLREARKIIIRADALYTKVGDVSGEVRDVSRAEGWMDNLLEEGKCEGQSNLGTIKLAQAAQREKKNPNAIPAGPPVAPLPPSTMDKDLLEKMDREIAKNKRDIEAIERGELTEDEKRELRKFKPIGEK